MCNLGKLTRSNPTFGWVWTIIFNTRIEFELCFFNLNSIWVGFRLRIEQSEANPNRFNVFIIFIIHLIIYNNIHFLFLFLRKNIKLYYIILYVFYFFRKYINLCFFFTILKFCSTFYLNFHINPLNFFKKNYRYILNYATQPTRV